MECGGSAPLSSQLNVRQQNDPGDACLARVRRAAHFRAIASVAALLAAPQLATLSGTRIFQRSVSVALPAARKSSQARAHHAARCSSFKAPALQRTLRNLAVAQ
jgi:hypothetical protein